MHISHLLGQNSFIYLIILMNNLEKKYNLMLVGTEDRTELIENIASYLATTLWETPLVEIMPYDEFHNWECKMANKESLRGKHVYVISDVINRIPSSTWLNPSINDKLAFSRYQLFNALEHGAKTINAVFPMFPYSRADQKESEWNKERSLRRPTSLWLELNILQMMWVDQLITLDMHNRSSTSSLDKSKINFTDLPTWWFVKEVMKDMWIDKNQISFFCTDEWWSKKIPKTAKDFKMKYWMNVKIKDTSVEETEDAVTESYVLWEVEWRHIILQDDIWDTMWTIMKTIENMHTLKPASINVALTHFLGNWPAFERLKKLKSEWKIQNVYITNSVRQDNLLDFIKVIDTDLFFADKIASIAKWESMDYNKNPKYVE